MTNIKEGYKDTEIGVIPIEWEVVKVGTILNVQTGKMNAQDQVYGGEYPFFTRSVNVQSIDTYAYDTEALFIAGEGNFKVKYYKGKFNLHQRTYMLTSIDGNNMKFLLNSIQPKVTKLISTSVGSTVQSLRKPIIEALKIPLPPLKEQEKIADILSTADDKIDAIALQIDRAQTLKKGLLQKLLSEGIGHSEFKDSELGKIPASWEVVKLDDMSIVITKGTTPTTLGFKYEDSGINFIKVESIDKSGNFIRDKFAYISEEANNSLQRSIIKENDLLLSIAGALGRVAIVSQDIVPANTNQALSIIRLKDEYIKEYVYFYLNSSQIQKHIDMINVQNAQANLSLQNIKNFKIALPPLEEQKQIADILSTADDKLEVLRAKKQMYETLKKGLLQKLLSGEVRV